MSLLKETMGQGLGHAVIFMMQCVGRSNSEVLIINKAEQIDRETTNEIDMETIKC